jgi:hypothetical protein
MEQFDSIDQKLLVLEQRDRWTPAIPALGTLAGVKAGANQAQNYRAHFLESKITLYPIQ